MATKKENSETEQPLLKDDDDEYRVKFWPAEPPAPDEVKYKLLQSFCDEVEVIIHVVTLIEFRAAVRHMDPPISSYERPVENFPESPIVIGKFAGKNAALVQTDKGARCRRDIVGALKFFKNAQCILLVGICYAFDKKYELGDVLVSDNISDMLEWKFTKEGKVQNRGQCIDVEDFLKKIFCRHTLLRTPFRVSNTGRESKIYPGNFVSFSALMDNEHERNKFHEARDHAIGGEMEGGAVLELMKNDDNNIKGIIIIKGVVDYGDGTKVDGWHFTSAMAAFNYTKSKLEKNNLPKRMVADSSEVADSPIVEYKDDIAGTSDCGIFVDNGASSRPTTENYPVLKKTIELNLMRMIRWKSQSDEMQELNLLEEMTGSWTTIGDLLELNPSKLTAIKMGSTDPKDWIRDVVLAWKKKGSKKYSVTWEGLAKLLKDSGLNNVADQLYQAIINKNSSFYE